MVPVEGVDHQRELVKEPASVIVWDPAQVIKIEFQARQPLVRGLVLRQEHLGAERHLKAPDFACVVPDLVHAADVRAVVAASVRARQFFD